MLSNRAVLTAALLARVGDPGAVSGPVQRLFSDIGWTGRPSDPSHPNRHFAPRVLEPLNVERVLPFAPGGARRSAPTVGDLVLINADGELDTLLSASVDGRPVTVLQGRPGADFADFEVIFKGSMVAWRQAEDAMMAIGLRGSSWQMDVPVARPLYLGTGGLEGGADIKGKSKPAAFGLNRNIQPALVSPANLIYQFHFRRGLQVIGCFDGGVAYTYAGDVPDITATSVAPGQFKTQLSDAGSYVRLGTAPTKTLTLDVRGDAGNGIYVERAADIAFRLLHDLQGLNDGWFEYQTFDALNLLAPSPVQIYLGLEPISATDVMDQIMAGINGWWSENRLGRIEVGLISLPAAVPQATLRMKDVLDFEIVALPESFDPPIKRVRVGYDRNWTPLDVTQIGQAIVTGDPARYAFLTEEYRFVVAEDPDVPTRNLRAQEFTLFSSYVSEAAAQSLANALMAIYSKPRRLARIRTKRQGYKIPLGATIAVDYPRYGLSGGRNVTVVGQALSASTVDSVLTVFW